MSRPRERLHSQTVVLAEHRPLNDASTTDSKATDIAYFITSSLLSAKTKRGLFKVPPQNPTDSSRHVFLESLQA